VQRPIDRDNRHVRHFGDQMNSVSFLTHRHSSQACFTSPSGAIIAHAAFSVYVNGAILRHFHAISVEVHDCTRTKPALSPLCRIGSSASRR
jgi:hypothetical protein